MPGVDPTVGRDVVLVSAHLDHLGKGRLGANDNASGISGLLTIAQAIASGTPPRRTVVFAAFSSEESGFEGAKFNAAQTDAEFSPDRVVYNVNMDMIGSYGAEGRVYAFGALPGTVGRGLVSANAPQRDGLKVALDLSSRLSDNVAFCEKGVPYVFFWTSDFWCYHGECDTADRIDGPRLVDVAQLVHDTVSALARSEDDLASQVRRGVDVCEKP